MIYKHSESNSLFALLFVSKSVVLYLPICSGAYNPQPGIAFARACNCGFLVITVVGSVYKLKHISEEKAYQ